jgi:hypothetical protein
MISGKYNDQNKLNDPEVYHANAPGSEVNNFD